MVSLFNEFIYVKNKNKRKFYQSTFAQSEKDRVKRKYFQNNFAQSEKNRFIKENG